MKKLIALMMAGIMLFIACGALAEGQAETQGKPLYATVGDALKAEKCYSAGGGEDYFAVVTEEDGRFYRSVAYTDEKLNELREAYIAAEGEAWEAARTEYENYQDSLPIAYTEEFTAVPMNQEEMDAAFVGKTVGELEEEGYNLQEQGTRSGETEDEIIIGYSFGKGLFVYACELDVDFDTYFKVMEESSDQDKEFKVKKVAFGGLSFDSYDKRFHTDGTIEPQEDPFAVMMAAEELAKQFTSEDGTIDLVGLEAALKEQFPDKEDEIAGIILMYGIALLSQALTTPEAGAEPAAAEPTPVPGK